MMINPYALLGLPLVATLTFAQTTCDQLKLSFPDAAVTSIRTIPAGRFVVPSGSAGAPAKQAAAPALFGTVPAYCQVLMILTPSSDSHIETAIFLPAENWNGKLQVLGNGGFGGNIDYSGMAAALRGGYATAASDTGHRAADGAGILFGLGHPEKITDFAYRAMHETVVKAKLVAAAFYGKGPKYSYYNGCSTGGRQGLIEATRFPEDFDAILAGAPANPEVHKDAAGAERSLRLIKNNAPLTQAKVETLHAAVLAKCDGLDGVKDGIISNPPKCRYDPAALLCNGADGPKCLTPAEVNTVKVLYRDIKTKKGEVIWTGFSAGTELEVAPLRQVPTSLSPYYDTFRVLGHQGKDYDWRNFDLEAEVAQADKAGLDVLTYDLSAFKAHGGKLLLYHGWSDPGIPAGHTVLYYEAVLKKMGKNQDDWLRLFMVPGMAHCNGGIGPSVFEKMGAIERWRELGEAPKEIVASRISGANVDMTRPLCPYPQVAVYKGAGSTNDAENFSCKRQ